MLAMRRVRIQWGKVNHVQNVERHATFTSRPEAPQSLTINLVVTLAQSRPYASSVPTSTFCGDEGHKKLSPPLRKSRRLFAYLASASGKQVASSEDLALKSEASVEGAWRLWFGLRGNGIRRAPPWFECGSWDLDGTCQRQHGWLVYRVRFYEHPHRCCLTLGATSRE